MNYCFFPSWFGSQSHLIWEAVSFSIVAWSLFLVWLFTFFYLMYQKWRTGREKHCTELLVVGRRQYWTQHLSEPVDEEMYCTLSELAWALSIWAPKSRVICSGIWYLLQSAGSCLCRFPWDSDAIPGKSSLSSPCAPGNSLTAIPKCTSSLACSQLDLAWELFLRVSPRVFYCLLKEEDWYCELSRDFPEGKAATSLLSSFRYKFQPLLSCFLSVVTKKRLIMCDGLVNSFCKYTR